MKPLPITPDSRSWLVAALVFIAAALLSGMLIWQMELLRLREARALVANLAAERAFAVQNSLNHALSATQALAALVRQGHGTVPDFSAIATQMLPFYAGVSALALAPDGVVREIIPLRGNEKAVGHDLLKDPQRTKEAFLARDTGKLTLAGPFELVQGGFAAAGRLPVFLDNSQGLAAFWGLTAILIRFPDILEPAQLPMLEARGFSYALWRIHPDSGKKQVIAASAASELLDPVEIQLQVPNATWSLGISPLQGWGDALGLAFKAALGVLFRLLLAGLTKLLQDARHHKKTLEIRVAQRTNDLRRFSEITAHHLQEPARRMASYADLLGRQLAGKLGDPETQMSLAFIAQQACRQQNLLRDVQRYLAADQPLGQFGLVDASAVAAQAVEKLSGRLAASGAGLTVGKLPPVWFDAARLGDVFELLIDNALRHGAALPRPAAGPTELPGDQVGDAARPLQIRLDGEYAGSLVRYCVSDNGPGIEPQYRERVFRPFERLQSGGDGTGIGLSLVRRIAESGGGSAWIEASPDGGCTVVLELPQAKASP